MVNRALEGKAYPPVRVEVTQERARRFADAVGDGVSAVPPTFVTAPEIAAGLAPAVADPELELDLARVLHGEQEYEWRRALRAGETLTARARIEQIRARGDLEFVTLRTEVLDEAGEPVVLARSVLIVRGGAP